MQKASSLARQSLQKGQKAHSKHKRDAGNNIIFSKEHESFIEQLFVRMQSNYMHGFSSAFPTANLLKAAKREWGIAMSKFDVADIEYALNVMQQHHKEFPPKLPQFESLCGLNKQYIDQPKLEHVIDKASIDVGKAALSKIRRWV